MSRPRFKGNNNKYYIDNKYSYRAYITDVYDGDTVTCNIDFGFGIIYLPPSMNTIQVMLIR